jgi:hypothetical protein
MKRYVERERGREGVENERDEDVRERKKDAFYVTCQLGK